MGQRHLPGDPQFLFRSPPAVALNRCKWCECLFCQCYHEPSGERPAVHHCRIFPPCEQRYYPDCRRTGSHGPRHFAVHPSVRFADTELGCRGSLPPAHHEDISCCRAGSRKDTPACCRNALVEIIKGDLFLTLSRGSLLSLSARWYWPALSAPRPCRPVSLKDPCCRLPFPLSRQSSRSSSPSGR